MRRLTTRIGLLAGLAALAVSGLFAGGAADAGKIRTIPGGPGLIAFQSRIITSGPTLFPINIMNPDGTGLTTLTTPNSSGYVAWAPRLDNGPLKLGWTDLDPATQKRCLAVADLILGAGGPSLGPISYIPVPVDDLPPDGSIESMDWGRPVVQADGSTVVPVCFSVGGHFNGTYRVFIRVVNLTYAAGQFQAGTFFTLDPGLSYTYSNARFSPDGNWLAVDKTDYLTGSEHVAIWLVNLATGSQTVLIDGPGSVNRSPAWSPDGTRLAFASNRSGNMDIYVAALNNDLTVGQITRWTTSRNYGKVWPTWSPDGAQISYIASSTSAFKVAKTTGDLVEYTLADGGWPDWSPALP